MERTAFDAFPEAGTTTPSFEELAAHQGVTPLDDFDSLLGHPSPEDETADEFDAMLRRWRTEASREREYE